MKEGINSVLNAIEKAGFRVVFIFLNSEDDGFYFIYTEFNYVDGTSNKLDVKGIDITDLILKSTLVSNISDEASFRNQLYNILGTMKEVRREFSHNWNWINYVPVF